jgi:hypothetical protein
VFLGLSSLTVSMLRSEGLALDFVGPLRAALLIGASAWSLWLGWRVAASYAPGLISLIASMLPLALAVLLSGASWATLFWS